MESCKLKKALMEKNSSEKPALGNWDGEEKKMMKKSSSGDGEDDLRDIKEVRKLHKNIFIKKSMYVSVCDENFDFY